MLHVVHSTPIALSRGLLLLLGELDVLLLLLADPGHRRFIDAVPGLTFKNGFVRVKNGQVILTGHSADHLARHAYPFDYNPSLAIPNLAPFLLGLFAAVPLHEQMQRINLYQEFVGTCLIGEATVHQKALVFSGEGGNGKSAALEVARAAFQGGSVVSLPPQLWSQRFQLAALAVALGNFVDEIPERDITGGEVFKAVVTGEPAHGERKHQPPFDFRPVAGHIFSANTLPGTVDQTSAYWRRFGKTRIKKVHTSGGNYYECRVPRHRNF